jgi:hypothetical protein
MDFWRYILAVAQVAAAAAINFEEVKSAPMARFNRVGEVFPDALYGQIIVTFDVAELRGQMKDLQKGILYRQERATPKRVDCRRPGTLERGRDTPGEEDGRRDEEGAHA